MTVIFTATAAEAITLRQKTTDQNVPLDVT